MGAQGHEGPAGQRGRIVRRYFVVFALLVGGSLAISAIVEMGFRFQETRRNLDLVHHQMAEVTALRIRNYIEDIAQAVQVAAHDLERSTASSQA